MTNGDANPQIDHLLQEGIKAARAGNKAEARDLLEQVVEQDEYNEKGWFWLAAVVETDEEKRVCLGNVVVINPDNARAKRLLDELDGGTKDERASLLGSDDGTGGSNRTVLILAVGLGVFAIVALGLVLVFVVLGGGDDDGSDASSPGVAVADTPENSDTDPSGGSGENIAADGSVTPRPTNTPIPTPTPRPRPATWTPVPTNTPVPDTPPTLYAPAPASVSGDIVMRAGRVPGDPDNQPIMLIQPDGTNRRVITPDTERGHHPVLSPDGTRYVFVKYAPGTREELLQINNLTGTESLAVSTYWAGQPILDEQSAPSFSPDGAWLAFTAQGLGSATTDLYRVALGDPRGDPAALERLTDDDAVESWTAYSPDGTQIAYIADLSQVLLDGGTELRLYSLETGTITNLTTNGNALIEAAPDWSPDGSQIVFHAQDMNGNDTDIYLVPASGLGEPEKIIDSEAMDIQPRFSPDGEYIVFSSNRTGNWDVFVYEVESGVLYQVTTDPETNIANDWR